VLNPAEPPMVMRDTIFCAIPPEADGDAVADSIRAMVADVASYVPGYRLLNEPQFEPPSPRTANLARVAVFVEVEGAGDYLPAYAGNLDVMTSAAVRVGELFAQKSLTTA
jgi:acetaldehyde dehydrogenase